MNKFNSNYKDSSSTSVGLSFIKVYNLWHRSIKKELGSLNLTHPQFVVLSSLGYLSQSNEEITQISISKLADIDAMTISTIIKNLEKSKLVVRQESKNDTRAKSVKLTNEGQLILNKALPIVEEIDINFFGALKSDKELFNTFLITLVEKNLE